MVNGKADDMNLKAFGGKFETFLLEGEGRDVRTVSREKVRGVSTTAQITLTAAHERSIIQMKKIGGNFPQIILSAHYSTPHEHDA